MLGQRYRELALPELAATLSREQVELVLPTFSLDQAWALGSELRRSSLERGYPVAIAIEFGEQRVFHAALPGASAENDAWIARKFAVVRHYGLASLAVRTRYLVSGESFSTHSRLDQSRYAADGGAVPLRVGDAMVGAVAVSGLEQHDDHALVVEALRVAREG